MIPNHATGSVKNGDVDLFYRRFGSPGATPILIVHGLSFFSYDWIEVASRIATDREVVAIDISAASAIPVSALRGTTSSKP